jgi:hypothetical protein
MPLRYDLDDDGVLRRPADDLRRLARYQRWIVGVVLAQIALWIGFLLLSLVRGEAVGDGMGFPLFLTVVLGFAGGLFAFLIYCTVRNPVIGLVMGAACVPPFLGVLALVVVNGVATRALESDGILVGMFGADADAIEDVPGLYDEQDGW